MLESGKSYAAKVFMDATYEGDLMAAAGVSLSRRSRGQRQVRRNAQRRADSQRRPSSVSARRGSLPVAGDPDSGLLPGVHANGPGEEGSGDHRVQAYCLRLCVTDIAGEPTPLATSRTDYDPLRLRTAACATSKPANSGMPWSQLLMPNRKTDTNNNCGFSTDFIGESYD